MFNQTSPAITRLTRITIGFSFDQAEKALPYRNQHPAALKIIVQREGSLSRSILKFTEEDFET